jgi:hypothetical protein
MKELTSNATDLFCSMHSVWRRVIPKTLVDQNPSVLVGYLRLAGERNGKTRSDLQTQLGVSQSNGSKLAQKLLAKRWLKASPDPGGDGRREILTLTDSGLKIVLYLEDLLFATYPPSMLARKRTSKARPFRRIGSFFGPEGDVPESAEDE